MRIYGKILLNPSKDIRTKNNIWINTMILVLLAFGTWILTLIARDNSQIVERFYSSTIYPHIGKSIGWISSILPISIAEAFMILVVLLLFMIIVLIPIKPKFFINNFNRAFHYTIRFLSIMYILFYFTWGFNYYREDYMDLGQMNKEPGTIQELKELTTEVISNVNVLREDLPEDENGVFTIKENFRDLSYIAQKGFENFNIGSINLDGNYGRAKPVFFSKWMSYTGIMGMYFPYTSEPNINTEIPFADLPNTICHEMAHQRGFAKEDEANFIAYKASINNPDDRFKYSGYYLAMGSLMNDLYKKDREAYFSLYSSISDAVKRDMDYSRNYWKSKEGPVEETLTTMNDNYLKANNQKHGVISYSKVVELLLSEYKEKVNLGKNQ